MATPYKLDFEGAEELRFLDGRDPLERWFKNWRVDKCAEYASQYEWLTVEENRLPKVDCYYPMTMLAVTGAVCVLAILGIGGYELCALWRGESRDSL